MTVGRGRVHVMAAPEDVDFALSGETRTCTTDDPWEEDGSPGTVVVYHVETRNSSGIWLCPACGETAGDLPEGEA